jgi:hypothetical protein
MGEEVLVGTLVLNKHPIIIPFDSRLLHDFMISTYAKKAKLSLGASGTLVPPEIEWIPTEQSRRFRLTYPGGYLAPTSLY